MKLPSGVRRGNWRSIAAAPATVAICLRQHRAGLLASAVYVIYGPAWAQIHTGRMAENSFLGREVDLFALAQRCRNFSGAEIEGLVKSAASFALNRQVDLSDLSKPIDEENLKARRPKP